MVMNVRLLRVRVRYAGLVFLGRGGLLICELDIMSKYDLGGRDPWQEYIYSPLDIPSCFFSAPDPTSTVIQSSGQYLELVCRNRGMMSLPEIGTLVPISIPFLGCLAEL